jgi:hypothetical protein
MSPRETLPTIGLMRPRHQLTTWALIGLALAVNVVLVLGGLGGISAGRAAPAGTVHYPDLRGIIPPQDLQIVTQPGLKELRYSHHLYNSGDGPLEIRLDYDPITNTARGFQRLYTHTGAPTPGTEPTKTVTLAPGDLTTIPTGWAGACAGVMVGSSNGDFTNFKNLVIDTPAPTQTITFDDLSNPNRPLTGQYPNGVIDWGGGAWYLSGPWGRFTTNSVSFNGATLQAASFSFISPRRLVQLDAYNGGTGPSTITLSCVTTPEAAWQVVREVPIGGLFTWHEPHGHYHYPMAQYGLYAVGPGGSVGAPVALSGKVGFCIADSDSIDPTLAHAGAFAYLPENCIYPRSSVGISVGWSDRYDFTEPGQSINITAVPDGMYWFRHTIDPNNFLTVKERTHNITDVRLQIMGAPSPSSAR